MKPTAPGTAGDPTWQGVLRLPDGRTFVTDGGLALDAALAKPAALPAREIPPKVLQDFFAAPHTAECAFADLAPAPSGKTYMTPSGIALNATYVNFLRRVAPAPIVRFRMTGPMKPVVILAGDKPIGVLMPVKQ
jgi:hypothetical protein